MPYSGSEGTATLLLKKAPLAKRSKRPCTYGPRGADGYCPKKPKAARKAATKPPCKYGPRLKNGRCPTKPKTLAQAAARDRAAGRSIIEPGSATRTAARIGVEASAQRAVTRTARKLETTVKKNAKAWGPAGAALLRALLPIGAIIGAAAFADSKFNALRLRDIERVAAQYRYTLAAIPTTGGKYAAAQARARSTLATWLGRELEAINNRYDKRAIDER